MKRVALAVVAAVAACGARSEIRGAPIALDDASISDAQNGSDAPDAPVDAGPCPPIDYVVDESTSTSLAMDDANLYYVADPGMIVRIAKDNTSSATGASVVGFDGDIVVDDAFVYWTMNAVLMRAPSAGGPTESLGCAALKGCPGNVHVKATTSNGFVVLVDGVQPVAIKKTGGPPVALAPANLAPPAPVHYLFATADWVFWNTDIRVFSAPFGIPQPMQYATSSSGLAIDSTHVYWTAVSGQGSWTTFQSDIVTPSMTPLSVGATHAPLVANDAFLYGVGIDGGITKQPTKPGDPAVIVPDVLPLTLLLDAQCVYFVERTATGRRISRAPN